MREWGPAFPAAFGDHGAQRTYNNNTLPLTQTQQEPLNLKASRPPYCRTGSPMRGAYAGTARICRYNANADKP